MWIYILQFLLSLLILFLGRRCKGAVWVHGFHRQRSSSNSARHWLVICDQELRCFLLYRCISICTLYSAVISCASALNLLRAIYIDGHVFTEDVIFINQIIMVLRLQNADALDHCLFIHVSELFPANLYALEGEHSTMYYEVDIYAMASHYRSRQHHLNKPTIAACGPLSIPLCYVYFLQDYFHHCYNVTLSLSLMSLLSLFPVVF